MIGASPDKLIEPMSKAGSTRITGKLVAFDGQVCDLQTGLGTLQVGSDEVTCTGATCPAIGDARLFSVAIPRSRSSGIFESLLGSDTQDRNAEIRLIPTGQITNRRELGGETADTAVAKRASGREPSDADIVRWTGVDRARALRAAEFLNGRDVRNFVGETPGAIGLLNRSQSAGLRVLDLRDACGLLLHHPAGRYLSGQLPDPDPRARWPDRPGREGPRRLAARAGGRGGGRTRSLPSAS